MNTPHAITFRNAIPTRAPQYLNLTSEFLSFFMFYGGQEPFWEGLKRYMWPNCQPRPPKSPQNGYGVHVDGLWEPELRQVGVRVEKPFFKKKTFLFVLITDDTCAWNPSKFSLATRDPDQQAIGNWAWQIFFLFLPQAEFAMACRCMRKAPSGHPFCLPLGPNNELPR